MKKLRGVAVGIILIVLSGCSLGYNKEWVYKEFSGYTVSSPALGLDGTIYVGMVYGDWLGSGGHGILYAIDGGGDVKWEYGTERPILTSSTVGSDGTIYIGTAYIDSGPEEDSGYVYAVNPDGTLKWRYPVESYVGEIALGDDGTIYCSIDGVLHALNPDGSVEWTRSDIPGDCVIAPDGTIYAYWTEDWQGYIHAINPDSSTKWIYECEDAFFYQPAVDEEGNIYISRYEGLYLHIITSEGTLRSKSSYTARIKSSPVLGSDGNIYFLGEDELLEDTDCYLYCIEIGSGVFKWRFEGGNRAAGGVAIGSDGVIYFSAGKGNNHYLYAVDSTGNKLWKYDVKRGIDGVPLISSDGMLYFVYTDRMPGGVLDYIPPIELHALQTESAGLASSSWPRAGGDNQNTGRAY